KSQLRNRLARRGETHACKEDPGRVRITRNTIVSVLEQVARSGREWMALARAADARDLAGQPVALDYTAAEESRIVEFRGYAYTRRPEQRRARDEGAE